MLSPVNKTVVIETLWNVNLINHCVAKCFCVVVIETLWNVNEDLYNVLDVLYGCCNRDIVECKLSEIPEAVSLPP